MAVTFNLTYPTAADFARHLLEHRQQGALLLRLPLPPEGLQQYEKICLQVQFPGGQGALTVQVVQVIADLGVAVQLERPADAEALASDAPPADTAAPPTIALVRSVATPPASVLAQSEATFPSPDVQPPPVKSAADEGAPPPVKSAADEGAPPPATEPAEAARPVPRAEGIPRGSSPLSWPIEKLQSDWHALTMADKVRLAKHGKRPARALIMRLQDQQLHSCLLTNPKISPDEVAVMAGKANLHPDLIKRIATSQEWLRHTSIVRNLVCNPKITTPQLIKLITHLPNDELRRLTRTGKVRAAAKQVIIRKLDQREGRRK